MSLKSITKLLLFYTFLIISQNNVYAVDLTTSADFNFNVIMQNAIPSVIPVTKEGLRDESGTQGVYKAQNPTVTNTLTFNTDGNIIYGDKLRVTLPTDDTILPTPIEEASSCNITFSNLKSENTSLEFFMSSSSYDIPFSITLSINEFCAPGKYSGYFDNVTYASAKCILGGLYCGNYSSETNIRFNYSFTIEEVLDVFEITSLNFGAILPINGGAGTLTVNPDGTVEAPTGDIKYISSAAPGQFEIYGIGGRQVNVTLDSEAVITHQTNNTDTMTVNNFKFMTREGAVGGKPVISMDDLSYDAQTNFYVGATLNVKSGIEPGIYSGTYNVEVSY